MSEKSGLTPLQDEDTGMKTFYQVRCFSNEQKLSGNPAGVFLDDISDSYIRQQTAAELKLPVTVYIDQSGHDIPSVEFYYPNRKMPLCLHGTLAAAFVLAQRNRLQQMKFRVESGKILNINVMERDFAEVEVAAESRGWPEVSVEVVKRLLNINSLNSADQLPFAIASVGSPKLLVPVLSPDQLASLKPDYDAIARWSFESKVNGLYVYCGGHDVATFHARGFNPIAGHHEDAATGVAAAALSSLLKRSITVYQGGSLNNPCTIEIRYLTSGSIWVGGRNFI